METAAAVHSLVINFGFTGHRVRSVQQTQPFALMNDSSQRTFAERKQTTNRSGRTCFAPSRSRRMQKKDEKARCQRTREKLSCAFVTDILM